MIIYTVECKYSGCRYSGLSKSRPKPFFRQKILDYRECPKCPRF